jgi:hypothetical protein
VHVARVEPADREPRLADRARRVGDVVQARGGAAGLGRRRVDGPDGEVVDVGIGIGDRGLGGRVGGAPDDAVRPDGRARRGGRVVVLADVHAVGAACLDQTGPVVEHEQRAGLAERGGRAHQPVVVERLVAQLDDVDAAAHRRLDPRPWPGGADEVQAGRGQALAGRHAPGDTMKRRTREPAERAERAPPGRRPSNLIRVVPA